MKKKVFAVPALLLGATLLLQAQTAAPTKIGIIHVQAAILGTKEGQKAAAELNAKIAPKKAELDKKQSSIDTMKDQLQKGSATMSDDAKTKLMRDIDTATTKLNRDSQDAQSDVEEEEGKIFNELGSKLYAIVEKYAKDNGYAMIVDVSGQQQPVWWASDAINITTEVVALYDKAHPSTGAAAPAGAPSAPAVRPSAPAGTPAPRPVTPPPAAPRKQ
ncbi:MAG: outer membrane chaperone Skp [Terriglobia bacterium]|nr:MAG: outer membrane chaperone Skp [Terriglobia bacterium]